MVGIIWLSSVAWEKAMSSPFCCLSPVFLTTSFQPFHFSPPLLVAHADNHACLLFRLNLESHTNIRVSSYAAIGMPPPFSLPSHHTNTIAHCTCLALLLKALDRLPATPCLPCHLHTHNRIRDIFSLSSLESRWNNRVSF